MLKISLTIVIALLLSPIAQAPADLYCDGDPPKLINKDTQSYEFQIKCGSKSETGRIAASAEKELDGKSGCKLKLGDNAVKKLFTEMVCTIKGGKLSCDLLLGLRP
jgi:hypothetical protein